MTLFALFADIHANREALDACVAHARAQGAEQLIFLGDLVGYGADPCYVVDLAIAAQAEGAIVIKGNHDAAIAVASETMNSAARAATDWTRAQLNARQKAFLAALPLVAELPDTLLVHADAADPGAWAYITHPLDAERSMRATAQRVTICGHVHRPQLYGKSKGELPSPLAPETGQSIALADGRQWLAVLGSVGQPRDEIPSAAYGLYDDSKAILTFQRAPYDIDGAAAKIEAANLPSILSSRLYFGR